MTWHQHRMWIIGLLLISGLVLAWFILRTPVVQPPVGEADVATTTSDDLTGRAIYTNGEYGFAISYPETAQIAETFSTTYHLGTGWRVNANPDSVGDPIIELVAYSTESDHSYPRYYYAIVRIGASKDAKDVASCETVTRDRGETALPDASFGGVTWKAFSFGDAGMQQYVRGVSYRTVHEGACFAIEKLAAGSSYQDDPDSPDDVSDAVLTERYEGLDQIVESFVFAR